jgi:DUF1680 family protein
MRLESTAHYWLFGGRLVIESKESKRFAVSIRVPSWVDEGASLKVNGKLIAGQGVESKLVPGEFYSIDRQWQDQDRADNQHQAEQQRKNSQNFDRHAIPRVSGNQSRWRIFFDNPNSNNRTGTTIVNSHSSLHSATG